MFKPLSIICRDKVSSFIWFGVAVAGQLGIIFSIIVNWGNLNTGSISLNFTFGNFYVFSISCLVFGIFDYVKEYYFNREIRFKGIKIIWGLLAGLVVFITICLYSSALPTDKTILELSQNRNGLWIQLVVYFLSIFIGYMMFCTTQLDNYYEDYKELDDKNVQKLQQKVDNMGSGGIEI